MLISKGAFDYLPKPFDIDDTLALIHRAITHYREQNNLIQQKLTFNLSPDMIGEAPAMQEVYRIIGRLFSLIN